MELLTEHILGWSLISIVILVLLYTAHIIKNEKKTFLKNAIPLVFKHFNFKIPSWWTNTFQDDNQLTFERKDTIYDWKAHFRWLPFKDGDQKKDLKTALAEIINEKKIIFDTNTSVIKSPKDFKEHAIFKGKDPDMIRVEGTATQDFEDRIYYDAFLIRDIDQQGFLFCESQSSILHGMLEGPYFEEALLNTSKNN